MQVTDIVKTSLDDERPPVNLLDGEGSSLDVDRSRQLRAEMAQPRRGWRA